MSRWRSRFANELLFYAVIAALIGILAIFFLWSWREKIAVKFVNQPVKMTIVVVSMAYLIAACIETTFSILRAAIETKKYDAEMERLGED